MSHHHEDGNPAQAVKRVEVLSRAALNFPVFCYGSGSHRIWQNPMGIAGPDYVNRQF
jgi:hypothetical protein